MRLLSQNIRNTVITISSLCGPLSHVGLFPMLPLGLTYLNVPSPFVQNLFASFLRNAWKRNASKSCPLACTSKVSSPLHSCPVPQSRVPRTLLRFFEQLGQPRQRDTSASRETPQRSLFNLHLLSLDVPDFWQGFGPYV